METRRWVNPSQAQTLYVAHLLLYMNAAITLLFSLGRLDIITLLLVAGSAGGAYGIANERKWGYWLALVVSVVGLLPAGLALASDLKLLFSINFLIAIVFPVALLVLLVHPQSRDYQRIWFH